MDISSGREKPGGQLYRKYAQEGYDTLLRLPVWVTVLTRPELTCDIPSVDDG
jgi:hypothetical protein